MTGREKPDHDNKRLVRAGTSVDNDRPS